MSLLRLLPFEAEASSIDGVNFVNFVGIGSTELARMRTCVEGTLFPGGGRGPGQREPLLDAAAWTPA